MRYLCVHCEHRFEAEGAEPPRRCPACMRATGVQPVRDEPVVKATARRSPAALLGVVALALLAAVAGYFMWGKRPSAGEQGTGGPLAPAALHDALAALKIEPGELGSLLLADASVQSFAKEAAGSASTGFPRAEAITAAIRARASALAFVPWSLGEPRSSAIGTAKQTLATLRKDKGRAQLYPLEVVALEVAALRSLGTPAMVAELISVDKERAPLDPSGYLGYFAVAVYTNEPGLGEPRLFDPYGGRALSATSKHTVLSDTRVLGAALATRALHETSYLADPRRALDSSSRAIQLAGTLPSVRTVRGMVVLASRQVEQGLQEFAAARQLRGDAPRLHNVASAELMTGDVEQAIKDVNAALALAPDYAAAHATLGSLALVRGEPVEARTELARAEELAPDLSLVQWALAELQLREGDRDAGLATARRALAARPSFDARVRMGVLLRQATRFDELREQAKQLLAMAPAYRQSEVRELISNVMGPAALDADARDVEAEQAAGEATADLPEPSLVPPGAASPGGENGAPEGAAPSFRLRDSNQKLQLNLAR
jgi:tetratricopeptide (TPR) repeat protein